jgi:hypothetical protein
MKVLLFRLARYFSLAALCLVVTPATLAQKDFALNVSVITSEHSRDSNSTTKIFRVSANTLSYQETYQGARASRHPPLKKEYELTAGDRARLIELLKAKALLRTKTIAKSAQPNGPGRDFEISITAKLAGKEGLISIKAPRSAIELKRDPLYQGSVLLIIELYRIINRTDPDMILDELIK